MLNNGQHKHCYHTHRHINIGNNAHSDHHDRDKAARQAV